jgi:methylenetetrahydrofolate dehydrogenase (NADP+)/methenyltetrahydrofolate cyclohydrolase
MVNFLYGKPIADNIINKISNKVISLIKLGFRRPHLVIILIDQSNYASSLYVKCKIKDCIRVGFKYSLINLPNHISESLLINLINYYNMHNNIDGIIVQLPLPKHINQDNIMSSINISKDVDGFHPSNFGKLSLSAPFIIPATPLGVIKLFKYYGIITQGKHIVIIGRSKIVGRPLSMLLSLNKKYAGNATVTLTHTYTKNLRYITKLADILIVAIGVPNFITCNMIKDKVILIDIGINYIKSCNHINIIGDVDFNNIYKKAYYITPVPGGIGPITRAMLIYNTFYLYKRKIII